MVAEMPMSASHNDSPADRDETRRPVELEPGVFAHPGSDRKLAVEHWLLAGSQNRERTRLEWRQHGVAMLPLGARFSAIRLPGRLVYALAGTETRADVDAFLEQALDGPVICDLHHPRYYALVSASVPVTWRQAVDDWRTVDVDCLGRGTILGVPRVDAVGFNSEPYASYWSVPMPSAGILCAPLQVARLIAAAQVMLHEEPEAWDGGAR